MQDDQRLNEFESEHVTRGRIMAGRTQAGGAWAGFRTRDAERSPCPCIDERGSYHESRCNPQACVLATDKPWCRASRDRKLARAETQMRREEQTEMETGNAWTKDEVMQLKGLMAEGKPYAEIAEMLGRTEKAVNLKVLRIKNSPTVGTKAKAATGTPAPRPAPGLLLRIMREALQTIRMANVGHACLAAKVDLPEAVVEHLHLRDLSGGLDGALRSGADDLPLREVREDGELVGWEIDLPAGPDGLRKLRVEVG